MLKAQPDHFLVNTEFTLAQLAQEDKNLVHKGQSNLSHGRFEFKDMTKTEVKDFKICSATVIGQLFLHLENNSSG